MREEQRRAVGVAVVRGQEGDVAVGEVDRADLAIPVDVVLQARLRTVFFWDAKSVNG